MRFPDEVNEKSSEFAKVSQGVIGEGNHSG